MHRFFFTILSALFWAAFALSAYEHQLTVCTIFNNEARWLPEWVEFLEEQGVERIYLYNNGSTDDYEEILKPYVDRGLVEIREWMIASSNLTDFVKVQGGAYTHCLKSLEGIARWCTLIDTDEFLFAPDGRKLPEVLKEYEAFNGVAVNWVCYGTSGVDRIPDGQKMTDTLLMRAPLKYHQNYFVKSIVKPETVRDCTNPHYCNFKEKKGAVTENKRYMAKTSMRSPEVSVSKLRINHYWSRDLDFFYNIKVDRWLKWGLPLKAIIEKEAALNAEYDDILLNYPHHLFSKGGT